MKWITIEPAAEDISMDHESDESSCRRVMESKGNTGERAESKVRDLRMHLVPLFDLKSYGSRSVVSSTRDAYSSNSGVYFNNVEVTGLGSPMHPLQICSQPAGKASYSAAAPKGRPLSTPSLAPFKVPKSCLENKVAPPAAEQARKRKLLSSTLETHLIPDESSSRASKISKSDKRELVVAELHCRDYWLSADEIMFVEAATKLACNQKPVRGGSDEGSKKHPHSSVLRTLNALPPPPFTLSILH